MITQSYCEYSNKQRVNQGQRASGGKLEELLAMRILVLGGAGLEGSTFPRGLAKS